MEEVKYDGLIEVHPDEIEDHKKVFFSKEKDDKTYFPFRYINLGYEQRCYSMITLKELESKG